MQQKMRQSILILFVISLIGSACATTGGQRTGGNSNRITAEEIDKVEQRYDTAYQIVQNLRPLWLRKRGRSSVSNPGEIAVYVDGARYGTPRSLRDISAIEVESMRFLSPSEATNRFGTGHSHGAILVATR